MTAGSVRLTPPAHLFDSVVWRQVVQGGSLGRGERAGKTILGNLNHLSRSLTLLSFPKPL